MLNTRVGCRRSRWMLAIVATALLAGAWLAPAMAAEEPTKAGDSAAKTVQPTTTAQPAATVPTRAANAKSPPHKAAVVHRTPKRPAPQMRVAAAQARQARECFFFCWHFFPLIHGVAY